MNQITESEPMPQNDPNNFGYFSLIWVILLSIWGGTVRTVSNVRNGTIRTFSLSEWFYDILTSAFIGVITYAFCQYSDIDGWLSAVLIGVASHEGTPAFIRFKNIIYKRLGLEPEKEEKS